MYAPDGDNWREEVCESTTGDAVSGAGADIQITQGTVKPYRVLIDWGKERASHLILVMKQLAGFRCANFKRPAPQ